MYFCVSYGSRNKQRFLILYTVGRTPWMGNQPIARTLPTHRHRINANIHTLSGIRTYDPSVRASEDSSCVRPRGHCARLVPIYTAKCKAEEGAYILRKIRTHETSPPNRQHVVQLKNPSLSKPVLVEGYRHIYTPSPPELLQGFKSIPKMSQHGYYVLKLMA
jgi:hypothetical protein